MKETTTTEKGVKFGSRLGFILAAAGSAVGLGNIWRFPYLAAKYGGGFFLLVYIILAVTFGFTLMLTEMAIGRRTGKGVLGAYREVNSKFAFLGWGAAIIPGLVLSYYCVIGGWVLKYTTMFFTGSGGAAAENVITEAGSETPFFLDYISHSASPTIFFVGIMSLINSFKIFREVYLLTGDYPFDNLYMLQHFMNNSFTHLDYSKLSAGAIVMCIVMIIIVGGLFFAESRFDSDVEE